MSFLLSLRSLKSQNRQFLTDDLSMLFNEKCLKSDFLQVHQ